MRLHAGPFQLRHFEEEEKQSLDLFSCIGQSYEVHQVKYLLFNAERCIGKYVPHDFVICNVE